MSLGKWKRRGLVALSYPLSRERAKRLYHWIEGHRAARRARRADAVVVSLPKSGRTWLRVMLWRFYQQRFALAEHSLDDLESYHQADPGIPYLYFTHDNHLRHYLKLDNPAERYAGKKVVLLVRDPRDGAVSMYFQWTYRMDRSKRFFSKFGDRDLPIEAFVLGDEHNRGIIHRRINVLNRWAKALPSLSESLVVRYEDLRADPKKNLGAILEFIGTPASEKELEEAVSFASFHNMREREARSAKTTPRRLRPGMKDKEDSFKTRRAQVGDYRAHFSMTQLHELDTIVSSRLDPIFGYGDQISEYT